MFDCIVGLNCTIKKRLLIDLCILRQCYELGELNNAVWILSAQNPADTMTKEEFFGALNTLLEENRILIATKIWIERPLKDL